jgi:hypothetical protein
MPEGEHANHVMRVTEAADRCEIAANSYLYLREGSVRPPV